jgi:4-diphosphocytidyl-2-C-methyl-D-erythritol kinase
LADRLRALPVSEPAPAKLNLFLRVLARRADGFHDIETLIQPVTLADGVRAAHADAGFHLAVTGERFREVPVAGDENLVIRAARALAQDVGEERGASLTLVKRIPVASGLGGGSADAAATLRALDRLWGSGLGTSELQRVAAGVGSDVPALVDGGPVLARGRGDVVEAVRTPRTWWVLLTPGFGVTAGDAYAWWEADATGPGPDPAPLLEALAGGDPAAVAPLLFNDLEAPVMARHPEVAEAGRRLRDAGALAALMCGSGPMVAGLARDGSHAEQLAAGVGGTAVASMAGPGGAA